MTKRVILTTLFGAILALTSPIGRLNLCAAEFHPFAGSKPIAVLIQTNPWAMLMGADLPRVAVYEDRTVIFLRESMDQERYYCRKLSDAEFVAFKKRLKPVMDLKKCKHFYSLCPDITDQPDTKFYLKDGEHELATRIYGLKVSGTELPGYTVLPSGHNPDRVPDELLELHKYLTSIDYPGSKAWTPRYVEVVIWPYEYAPEPSIVWPKAWPSLDSGRSIRHADQSSIFLDGSVLPALEAFLQTRKEKGAVEIGGKKWTAYPREVFPSEPIWRKAFRQAEEK